MHRTDELKPSLQPNHVRTIVHEQACQVLNDHLFPRWLKMSGKKKLDQLNFDDVLKMNYGHDDSIARDIFKQIHRSMKGDRV